MIEIKNHYKTPTNSNQAECASALMMCVWRAGDALDVVDLFIKQIQFFYELAKLLLKSTAILQLENPESCIA